MLLRYAHVATLHIAALYVLRSARSLFALLMFARYRYITPHLSLRSSCCAYSLRSYLLVHYSLRSLFTIYSLIAPLFTLHQVLRVLAVLDTHYLSRYARHSLPMSLRSMSSLVSRYISLRSLSRDINRCAHMSLD
jgi:hypothetical protein